MLTKAEFILGDKKVEMPVIVGSEGEVGVDISALRSSTGAVTLDPGYMNTGACQSAVTFIDGDLGILRYRGYSIEELSEKSTFAEVAYLLIYGELPTAVQLSTFEKKIAAESKLPEGLTNILKQFPKNTHPMAVMSSMTTALSAFNPNLLDTDLTPEKQELVISQLLGQFKVIATQFYQHAHGASLTNSAGLGLTEDFCQMFFGKVDPVIKKAIDILFILHADHEQNCSTSTVRLVGSSKANLYTTIGSGVSALWGPLHGGANQKVIEMLEEIHANGGDYKKTIEMVKEKKFKLFGFGHRVYKNFDPRAKIIKNACDTVLNSLGVTDPLLEIARGLEEAALNDQYFIERKLYPNVDFYSGVIYRALGIPTEMFTVMFALGRLPGWIAQWKESMADASLKIGRPRQIYTGSKLRAYTSLDGR